MRPAGGGGVRVTGGTLRGRALPVPASARPTEGRVREALFSIWRDPVAAPGCRFLDLFAGSGVVGIEAASRGAFEVLCVDDDAAAVRLLAATAAALGERLVTVRRLTLPAGLARLAAAGVGRFDLVFADPPYRFDAHAALLTAVAPLLATDAEVAVEHSARHDLPLVAGPLVRTGARRYGESALSFYRLAPGPPGAPGALGTPEGAGEAGAG
jgi:16S rRNA (guanine966-N2)-methyltransferase